MCLLCAGITGQVSEGGVVDRWMYCLAGVLALSLFFITLDCFLKAVGSGRRMEIAHNP